MRILIAGVDGYLGWSLAQYLTDRGHEVAGACIATPARVSLQQCSSFTIALHLN